MCWSPSPEARRGGTLDLMRGRFAVLALAVAALPFGSGGLQLASGTGRCRGLVPSDDRLPGRPLLRPAEGRREDLFGRPLEHRLHGRGRGDGRCRPSGWERGGGRGGSRGGDDRLWRGPADGYRSDPRGAGARGRRRGERGGGLVSRVRDSFTNHGLGTLVTRARETSRGCASSPGSSPRRRRRSLHPSRSRRPCLCRS